MARPHLSAEEMVDLAEGRGPAGSPAHLAECERCRRELADLRAMLSAVAEGDVPEPSPLFWDHFSDRVRAAVAAEGHRAREPLAWWRASLWSRASTDPLLVVGVVLIAVVAVVRLLMPPGTAPAGSVAPPVASEQAVSASIELDDDPALSLMSDLTTTWNLDEIREQVTRTRYIGGADEAFGALTDDEREELQRLLTEQLAQPSAS